MTNEEANQETAGGFSSYDYRLLKETPRNWQVMKDRDAILTLIEDKLQRRPLYLKGTSPAAEFVPGERRGDGLEFYYNPSVKLGTHNTLFITLNRQLELDFSLGELIGPGHVVLIPLQARVGSVQRASPRFALEDGEVTATNFRISTNSIAPNNTKLQITTKVIFPEFEKLHQGEFKGLKVFLARDGAQPPGLPDAAETGTQVSIQGRPYYLQPVYVLDDRKSVLLARILIPLAAGLQEGLSARAEELADELLQKVIDANASLVKERQRVVNISEGGVALQIDSEVLQKNLPLRDWLTFDLLFKMHAPIRFYGNIRYIGKKDNEWLVGIDLSGQGHSHYGKSTKEVYRSLIQKLLRS